MAQIAKIRELTAGWCGPRSSPISAGVIDRTLDILAGIYTPAVRAPHLAPMACDAIIVECNTQGLEVSIEVAVASWPIAVDVYNPTDDQGLTVFCHTIEEIRAALPFREESYKKKIDDNNQHGVTRMTDLTTDERNTILHTLGLTPVNGKMPRWSAFLIKDGLYRFEELDLISGVYYTGPNMVLEQLGYELEEPNGAPGWLRAELEHAAKAVDHWSAGMRKESHMSKREVYVCDRCGTQSNEKLATFYEDELNGPTQNDIASGKTESRHYTVDLCFPCVAIFARRMQKTGDLADFNKGFKRPVKPQF